MAASDDKLYATGGGDGDVAALPTLFEYDADLDSWSTKTPMPGRARIFSAAVVLRGKLYVVGGSDSDSKPVSTVEMYNPDTDSWTSLPDYPSADGKGAYQHITGVTVDGEVAYFVANRIHEDMSVSSSTLRLTSPTPTPTPSSGSGSQVPELSAPGSNGALIGGFVGGVAVALVMGVGVMVHVKLRRALYRLQAARLTMSRASASPSLASV